MDSLDEMNQKLAIQLQVMVQKLAEAAALTSNIAAKDASAKAAIIANIRG
jgi:hypothetical protein